MKKFVSSMIFGSVLATGLVAASPVSAQEVNRTVTITRDSKVGGQAVTKGEYSIKFAEGKDGDMVLLRGKKEVLKASYKVTKLAQPAAGNSVSYTAAADGSYQLKRIEFKGKSEAIVFE
jgi:NMD protein affecting ribosome stability and mRNA decay